MKFCVKFFVFITILSLGCNFLSLNILGIQKVNALLPPTSYINNSVMKNFPIGMFEDGNILGTVTPGSQGETDFIAMINNLKSKGFDSVLFTNNSIANQTYLMTVADQQDFNVVFSPLTELNAQWWYASPTVDLSTAISIATPIVNALKNHPSLRGYHIADDLDYGLNKYKIALMMQAFKQLDPNHPVFGVLHTSDVGPELFTTSASAPNINLTSFYPSSDTSVPCQFDRFEGSKTLYEELRDRNQNQPSTMPLWTILQTHSTANLRTPTAEELRLQNWESIGEGSHGIFWFIYSTQQTWTGLKDNPTLMNEASNLASRVGKFRELISNTNRIDDKFKTTASSASYSSTLYDSNTGANYVVIANQSCAAQNIKISSDYYNGQLLDLEDAKIYNMDSVLNFSGGDGHIFRLINPSAKVFTASTSPNLIQNGNFESLGGGGFFNNWDQDPAFSVDSVEKHTGNYSLKIQKAVGTYTYDNQNINLSPSTKYSFSYWYKTIGSDTAKIATRYVELLPTQDIRYSSPNFNETGWIKRWGYFYTTPNIQTGRFDIFWEMPTNGDAAWIDDIVLCQGDENCQADPNTLSAAGALAGYQSTHLPNPFVGSLNKTSPTNSVNVNTIFSTTDTYLTFDHYEVKLDSGSFTVATSPFTLSNLTEGAHTVTVRAFNNAGTFIDSVINFVSDFTSPVVTITAPIVKFTSGNITTTNLTITDNYGIDKNQVVATGGTVNCVQVDSKTITCTSIISSPGTFNVTVTDTAGNVLSAFQKFDGSLANTGVNIFIQIFVGAAIGTSTVGIIFSKRQKKSILNIRRKYVERN